MQKLKKMMMEGIKQNDLKKVAWALNLGLDINALLWGGFTPLHWAKNIALVELLISAGADVNVKDYKGDTPLHRAVWMDNIELAKLLIASGTDVNAKDNYGETPLHLAKSEEMKVLLEQHGATI